MISPITVIHLVTAFHKLEKTTEIVIIIASIIIIILLVRLWQTVLHLHEGQGKKKQLEEMDVLVA